MLRGITSVALLLTLGLMASAWTPADAHPRIERPPLTVNEPPLGVQVSLGLTAQRATSASPPPRDDFSVAYDSARGRLVLFGGSTHPSNQALVPFADTWTWDGNAWTQQTPPTGPPARWGAGMTYDAALSKIVLFGGVGPLQDFTDTWSWDGSTWTQEAPARSPPGRGCCLQSQLVYDGARAQVVLVSPAPDRTDTWTWDGSNWTQQSPPAGPPSRRYPSLSYDPVHQVVVMFGGCDVGQNCVILRDDTWIWDGASWTKVQPAQSPPARAFAVSVYDSKLGQAVLYGGATLTGQFVYLNDAWSWDGSSWTPLALPTAPPATANPGGLVYGDSLGGLVLVGADISLSVLMP